jgi:hypothetical protein
LELFSRIDMAILCRDLRLLFVQAPRTACTAIEILLVQRFGGESLPPENILDRDGFIRVQSKHCTIPQLRAEGLLPADYASRYTTLTTVRNPFDSLVSLYVKKRDKYEKDVADPTSWVHSVRGYVEDIEFCRTHTFSEWAMKRYAVGRLDRLLGKGRRSLYGRYTAGVETVMRFERLQQDFEAVMRRLGIEDGVTIPAVNRTAQRSSRYQEYYTPETRKLVEYVFRDELTRYGYSFDGFNEGVAVSGALVADGSAR